MLIFLYVLLLALLGFMGGISFGVSPVSLKFFSNGSCFTLYESILYMMTIILVQWRAVIRIFNCHSLKTSKNVACNIRNNISIIFECLILCFHYFESFIFSLITCLYIFLLLCSHGDIELNPGANKSKENNLSICHWNLNSITAHNFVKLSQLKAYISTYKHDFICLSETYLGSSTPSNMIDKDIN